MYTVADGQPCEGRESVEGRSGVGRRTPCVEWGDRASGGGTEGAAGRDHEQAGRRERGVPLRVARRDELADVQTGQFFDFDFSAKEEVQQQVVANGVAIVVTNQRYAGIGVFTGGWQSIRRIAGESVISAQAQDYSALIVTSDRVLAFNGRTGSWSDRKR